MANVHDSIIVVLPNANAGGAQVNACRLANAMAESGTKVEIVVATGPGPIGALVTSSIPITYLNASRVAKACLPLARHFRNARPRAIMSMIGYMNVVTAISFVLARMRCPLVLREATDLSSLTQYSMNGWKSRITNLLRAAAYWRADVVIAPSIGAAQSLHRVLGVDARSVTVVPNAVVSEHFHKRASEPIVDEWIDAGVKPLIVGLGRLSPEKGFDILLRAVARIRRQTSCRLWIIGEGPERKQLESLRQELGLDDAVRFLGFIANPLPYLKASEVFVLSSRREGMPNALIEALALGVPVVATDCRSGPREILECGRWGRLAPVDDDARLAECIVETLADPCRLDGSNAVLRYSAVSVGARYEQLIQRAIVERQRRTTQHSA